MSLTLRGWTEQDTCDCCGRTGLARTLAIEVDSAMLYYGSDCARKYLSSATGEKWTAGRLQSSASLESIERARLEWVWYHPSGQIIRRIERKVAQFGSGYPAEMLARDSAIIAHHEAILQAQWAIQN